MTPRGHRNGGAAGRSLSVLAGGLALILLAAAPAVGQEYRMEAPSGETMTFSRDSVQAMLARTRALYDTLEADPRIVYYVGYGQLVPEGSPGASYPWAAVTVRSDSAVQVVTPGNLREADRAYFNYAVVRMRERSAGANEPDTGDSSRCDEVVAREARILAAFADGWVVARTLFGSPAYPPLGEIAFARAAGHLEAYAADHSIPQLQGCGNSWREEHPERMQRYRRWRGNAYLGEEEPPASESGSPMRALRQIREIPPPVHSLRGN